ncbi:WD repeat-containing protein 73 isoform X1 [Poecile atricapillus]|uniref:WD repeat-containing protein 73 isoform X1 n=1 Tax=Poecile atricapillus TaxID=48891 RepID=UPI0027392868|nr:WD repeat-containing protein 73 isoform X1 [Poecile atricapillus]
MEAADEWLLQSLRLYRDLHTFELQAPTRLIEWARGNRVCVAGYGQSHGNEILQLIPPPTLLTKETQGLCPERDFKVECGGFSERPVYSLKYVPDTSLLVTSGPPDNSLQVWQVSAEDSDVIKSVSTIATENVTGQSWAKIATISARAPWVLHGSRLDRVQITEVESRKNVYTTGIQASRGSEELSGLAFLDCNTLLLCCATGRLCLADIRQPQCLTEATAVPSAPCSEQWCMGTRHGAQGLETSSQPVARLSSRGLLILTDLRKTSEFLALVKTRVPSPASGAEFLCVSWAPALEGYLAISGFDGTVHVYDTQSWDSSGREAEPIFIHKGHAFGGAGGSGDSPLVTVHTWHLQKPRTLLSAASDGSLHVWDWVQPCGKCG